MKSEQLPDILYRPIKGSRAGTRTAIVCALQYDGASEVPVDADRVSWTARAATLLRELGNAGGDSGKAQGNALPYASLRAAIAATVPEAVLLERDLGCPWLDAPKPFLDVAATSDLLQRLGQALSLWVALALRPWAEKVGASEELVDALHGLSGNAFAVSRREGNLPDVLTSVTSFPEARDIIVQRFAQALEGQELFEGLGPVWRIVRGRSASNELEFATWPAQHDEGLFSMVACIAVETIPFSTQPIVTVRASRRRWLSGLPSERALTGQRGVTVTVMGREGPHVALEVSAPVRSQQVQDPIAPEFLGQLLRLGGDLATPLAELVESGAGGRSFVGVAYSPKLGGAHPIGAGVSTRDQTDLFDAVQVAVDGIGFFPLEFEETLATRKAPKRSAQLHKALEVEALLSDVAVSIGRNDLEDDASIEAAWKSLGFEEDGPQIKAAAGSKAREKLIEVRDANVERVTQVFGDRKPSVVVIARTEGERGLLQAILVSLFGKSIDISVRPLPADVHGARNMLRHSEGKTQQRFEARVAAWRPLAQVMGKTEGGSHALVQATDWYDGRPDDHVNKLAGRYALASEANANVQYLRPRGTGHRGFANYLHRVQAASYDLVFGHSGLVTDIADAIESAFPNAEDRPTSVVGISVLAQQRTRTSGKSGKLCIATRIDCVTGRTTARVGWHDGEMRWSAQWEALFDALKRIASPEINASLGSGLATERASFQSFVREILDDCADVGDRPVVMIDSTSAASLWPWLTDGQIGDDIALGSERLDVSRRWPGIRLVRVRLGHAARIAERKTVLYQGVDVATGADTDKLLNRYCPTIVARTVRLSNDGASTAHYWSTTGYFQMSFPRGLSVYRSLISLVPVSKAFRDISLPPGTAKLLAPVAIPIFEVSYRLPNPIEITVATVCDCDDPDRIAHLVASLRYGYGHTAASTSLPAPLSFESKARDYMTRFALDVSDEEDDEVAEKGTGLAPADEPDSSGDVPEEQDPGFQVTDPRAWRQLVDKSDVAMLDGSSVAAAQVASQDEFDGDATEGVHQVALRKPVATGNSTEGEAVEPAASERRWSELAPVLRLPDFVTLDWLSENVNVPNAQLRVIHQARDEIARLTGFTHWPETKPDQEQFLELLLEGLRYPRFAAAITQIAKRSLPQSKRVYWTPFKPLLQAAIQRGRAILVDRKVSSSALNTLRGMTDTLASAGNIDLALAHIFRRAYVEPLGADILSLIESDARFEPLRKFAADATVHLLRDDYEWNGDLSRFQPRPVELVERGSAELAAAPVDSELPVASEHTAAAEINAADDTPEPTPLATEPLVNELELAAPLGGGQDASTPDGMAEWIGAMAIVVDAARAALTPDHSALGLIAAQIEIAGEALARYETARPRSVDATALLDRALEAYALALAVLVDAEEDGDGLPKAPTGPFASTIDQGQAVSLEGDLDQALAMAELARQRITEAQRIVREMQMGRLQEAVSLKLEAVVSGRDAASRAVSILEVLKDETIGEETAKAHGAPETATERGASDDAAAAVETADIAGDLVEATRMEWDAAHEQALEERDPSNDLDLAVKQALQNEVETLVGEIESSGEADPMGPQLVRRFAELVSLQRFALAYHLSSASTVAGIYDDFPISQTELKLAAIAGHVNHASAQGSELVQELLLEAHATFENMNEDEPNVVARRIMALASLAPFALYHNDPEAKLALYALRQVGDGLGEAVHAFRESMAAPLRSGLSLSPSHMRLASEEAQEDEYAQGLALQILANIEDFSQKTYKFQLGNKLRNALTKGDGELARLRDRIERGGPAALEATRDFANAFGERNAIIRLLEEAEVRVSTYKLTGIDGIARERMVGLIQGIASVCAEYVETSDAAPATRGARDNIQRARSAIVDATSALCAALAHFETATPLEQEAVDFARKALADFLETVNGIGLTPHATDHLVALYGPLLWLPSLDFGQGWLPAPYVPEQLVGTVLTATREQIEGPTSLEAFAREVRARIETGSHIAASMMISAAGFSAIPPAEAAALDEARAADVVIRRDALTADLRATRLMVDRVQRMGGAGSLDEAQSLLSLLDRISPDGLPVVVPLESRGEAPEGEQILDFKAAYGLVADVRTKVDTLLKRPRDALLVRIADLAKVGIVAEPDLDKVRSLVARDDLLTATEYLEFLENGRALPETTSPNPRFRAYFPKVPELLAAMSRTEHDAIGGAIERGEEFAELNFGRISDDRRIDVREALDAWNELRRAVSSGRAEADVAGRLSRMLEKFGLDVKIQVPNVRGNRRIYSADMQIDLLMDKGSVLLPDFGSMTGGDYRVCIGTKMPSDAEVRTIQADAGALRVVFFVTETVSPERRKQLQLSCLENSSRLLVIDESMIFFALAEQELRGLTLFELAQPFSFADPYRDYGNAAVPREMFFGRAIERRKLLEPHGSCIVYGGRRLGKTALLRHIQAETDDPGAGMAVAYVNIFEIGANAVESQIWEYMSRELKTVFPKPVEQSEAFSDTVRQWLDGDSKRRVLVLLDESDRFIQADANKDFAQFVRLQRLMDDTNRRFKFVLAGLHNVTRLVHTENPPLKQIASDPQRIGPLMDEELGDAEALVTRPLAGMGYEFENREDVWRILSYCNYYPVLVQKFCEELLQELVRETTKKRRPVTAITSEHIRAALENERIANEIGEIFDYTISKIEDRYSLIANIVADRALRDSESGRIGEGMSAVEVRDAAVSWWPAAFSEANRLAVVEDLLDEMEGLGVLRRVPPGRWALRSATILRLLGHDDKIAAKLGEFLDRPSPPVFDPRSMRRRLKANQPLRVQEGAMCPLTLGQEHDVLRARDGVTLVFGNSLSDIGLVTGALTSADQTREDRGVAEITARSFLSPEAMLRELKGAPQGEPPILHVVHDLSPWDAGWVDRALRARVVRDGRARVLFVGRPEHALSWVLDTRRTALERAVKIVALQTWSATLIDDMLQQEHLDTTQFRGQLRAATGGYNQPMQQSFVPGSNVTSKSFATRLQTTATRRLREPGLPAELGLIGDMSAIFKAIASFTDGDITAYEIGEGPVTDLGLEITGQDVVDFGTLMGLLEPQPVGTVGTEDSRPFRLNPLVSRLLEAGSPQ